MIVIFDLLFVDSIIGLNLFDSVIRIILCECDCRFFLVLFGFVFWKDGVRIVLKFLIVGLILMML